MKTAFKNITSFFQKIVLRKSKLKSKLTHTLTLRRNSESGPASGFVNEHLETRQESGLASNVPNDHLET